MAVVEAQGTASGSNIRAQGVEDVMAEAVRQCGREGIIDPVEIKRRMLEARDRLKAGR